MSLAYANDIINNQISSNYYSDQLHTKTHRQKKQIPIQDTKIDMANHRPDQYHTLQNTSDDDNHNIGIIIHHHIIYDKFRAEHVH